MQTDESQPESKRIMPESETDDCLLFLSMIEKIVVFIVILFILFLSINVV